MQADVLEEHEVSCFTIRIFEDGVVSVTNTNDGMGFDAGFEQVQELGSFLEDLNVDEEFVSHSELVAQHNTNEVDD